MVQLKLNYKIIHSNLKDIILIAVLYH